MTAVFVGSLTAITRSAKRVLAASTTEIARAMRRAETSRTAMRRARHQLLRDEDEARSHELRNENRKHAKVGYCVDLDNGVPVAKVERDDTKPRKQREGDVLEDISHHAGTLVRDGEPVNVQGTKPFAWRLSAATQAHEMYFEAMIHKGFDFPPHLWVDRVVPLTHETQSPAHREGGHARIHRGADESLLASRGD